MNGKVEGGQAIAVEFSVLQGLLAAFGSACAVGLRNNLGGVYEIQPQDPAQGPDTMDKGLSTPLYNDS
jgi:hypothetical protein